jgi:hypothetical protein
MNNQIIMVISLEIDDCFSIVLNVSAKNHSIAIHILKLDSFFLAQYLWNINKLAMIQLNIIYVDAFELI